MTLTAVLLGLAAAIILNAGSVFMMIRSAIGDLRHAPSHHYRHCMPNEYPMSLCSACNILGCEATDDTATITKAYCSAIKLNSALSQQSPEKRQKLMIAYEILLKNARSQYNNIFLPSKDSPIRKTSGKICSKVQDIIESSNEFESWSL